VRGGEATVSVLEPDGRIALTFGGAVLGLPLAFGLPLVLGLPLAFGLPLALGLAAADGRTAVTAVVSDLAPAMFGRDVAAGFAARADAALDADPGLAAVPDLAVPDFAVPDLAGPVFALAAAGDVDAARVPDLAGVLGAAADTALTASVRDLVAMVMALVAAFIACMAVDIVLAEVVALVAAAVILVAAEVTLVAAEETVRIAAAGAFAAVCRVVLAAVGRALAFAFGSRAARLGAPALVDLVPALAGVRRAAVRAVV
jgi:hypothetical protein